jgi:PRTRC genetic system protein C
MEYLVYSSAYQSALKTYDNEGGGGGRRKRKSMTIETMGREFRYDGVRLPDPNPKLSIEEVRTAFSATYPEIATAAVTGPEAVGNKLVYHFAKAIGTKG